MDYKIEGKFTDISDTLQYMTVEQILFKQYLHDKMTVHISLLILMTINVVINLLCGTVFYIKNFGLFASINNLLLLILLIVIDKIITIRFNNNKKFLKQLYNIEE